MRRYSGSGKKFGVFAVSGSTLASMVLSAVFYLVLPLSIPVISAQNASHCHCVMCRTGADEGHHCCTGKDGICNCSPSSRGDSAEIVIIRDIPSLPVYGKFDVPFLPGHWKEIHQAAYTGIVLPVEIPPPQA